MIATTCPTCGTQCRIAGDPASVTRWYEPVMQEATDALRAQIKVLKDQLESACNGRDNWYLAYTQDTAAQQDLINELVAEKAAHVCRAAIIQTIRTPDLVIEEE